VHVCIIFIGLDEIKLVEPWHVMSTAMTTTTWGKESEGGWGWGNGVASAGLELGNAQ
jgi:hypothetical protein